MSSAASGFRQTELSQSKTETRTQHQATTFAASVITSV